TSSLDVLADDAELGQPADELPRDLGPFPGRADDRHDLLVDKAPDRDEPRPLLVGELLAHGKEVRAERLPEMPARHLGHPWLPSAVRSVVVDVCPRRLADRHPPASARLAGRGLLLAAAPCQPARVVRPPGARAGPRAPDPLLRILRTLLGHLVAGLLVSWRV